MIRIASLFAAATIGLLLGQTKTTSLDFEVFKAKVQPIFLSKRPGHARCYVCHSQGTNFRLQPLSAGSTAWNEESLGVTRSSKGTRLRNPTQPSAVDAVGVRS
jgi:hypothetical protein